jgi:hypothetical protein
MRRASVKKTHGGGHGKDSSARSIALASLAVRWHIQILLDAYGGSVLLTTIRVSADVIRSNATPLFVWVAKVFGGLPPFLPEERIIKTSILGDL